MSHTDYVATIPNDFQITAHTSVCPIAAFENPRQNIYAVQFHPEVMHTIEGNKMLGNFIKNICHCAGD